MNYRFDQNKVAGETSNGSRYSFRDFGTAGHNELIGFGMVYVLNRSTAGDAVCERLYHLLVLAKRRCRKATDGATILLVDDHILRGVNQTTCQVTRVSWLQRRIRQTLTGTVGRDEVLENGQTLFIFDEPTTGLHFYDIEKLLIAFNALLDKGHSLVVIEHNMEVIKCADHIIDLGPDGGENGGYLLFEGHPRALTELKDNQTGYYLKTKI